MVMKPKQTESGEQLKATEDSEQSSEKPKKKRKDRRVEREYFDWVEVTDPTTGQVIKQKVKITRYKTKGGRFAAKPVVEEEELGYNYVKEDED